MVKKIIIAAILILLNMIAVHGQTFGLKDTIFQKGEIYIPLLYFDFGKCNLRPESSSTLDSIFDFLDENRYLRIEVGYYWESKYRGHLSANQSQCRAESIVESLTKKGIGKRRLKAVGFGIADPIISDEEIAEMKSREEKDEAHSSNRRVELRIIEVRSKERKK